MGAKEETLQQRDLYKSHLEFLGFDVECDSDDPQDMMVSREGQRMMARTFRKGVRLLWIYGISDYAESHRDEFLEYVNQLNQDQIAAKFVAGKDSILIYGWLFAPYERVTFGNWLDMVMKEVEALGDIPATEKFLG